MNPPFDPAVALREGVEACRRGKWREGYDLLTRIAQRVEKRGNLPGAYYSYLGLAMARCEGRRQEGMELCRYGARLQPDKAEVHINLCWLYLMLGRRRSAWASFERAAALRPGHPELEDLRLAMGARRPTLLPFLDRGHPVNRLAGRARHWLATHRAEPPAAD